MKVSGNDLFVTAMKKEGVDTIVTGLTSYYQDMSRG